MVLAERECNDREGAAKTMIEQKQGAVNEERVQIVRPTEAQLRWSQFHHKSRAKEVQAKVLDLWQTPLNVSEVDGATSDDGATTSDSSSQSRKREKPKISRGRRAMLRMSKRAYVERRRTIAESGFQCTAADKENNHQENDLFNEMFNFDTCTTRKVSQRRRTSRLSRGVLTSEDDERMRRFEAAYSMMMNMRPQQQPELMIAGKRWTRPEHMKASISIDGRSYEAWKWGLNRQRRHQLKSGAMGLSDMPFDRRASWMVHLPAKESSSRRYAFTPAVDSDGNPMEPVNLYDHPDLLLSPGQMKFDDIVMSLQHTDGSFMFPHEPHRGAGLQQYEQHLENYYRRKQGSPHFTRPNKLQFAFNNSDDTTIMHSKFVEKNESGSQEPESQSVVPIGDSDVSLQTRDVNNSNSPAARNSHPSSENIVKNSNAPRRQGHGYTERRRESDIYSVGASSLGESDFFAQARKMQNRISEDMEPEKDFYAIREHENSVDRHSNKNFGIGKRSSLEDSTLKAVPEASVPNDSPEKSTVPVIHAGKSVDDESVPVNSSSSFRLGSKMSGLLNMVTGKKTSDGGESSLSAYAAFRERVETNDDTSSMSSFRMLPDSIRRAVQGFTAKGKHIDGDAVADEFSSSTNSKYADIGDVKATLINPESTSVDKLSPPRSFASRSVIDKVSPEHGKIIHQRYLQSSTFLMDAEMDETIIDTDDTTSDASGAKMDAKTAASLMLSPTILTRRHRQAIKAVEIRNWEQVMYLISANPWLSEMIEVTTEQYLLHKVAFYGAGEVELDVKTGEIIAKKAPAAPEKLNLELIRMMPSSVHKFDKDGNLPLHMAAASGNVAMAKLLGERFPSGASVRNEEGMLPLHLAIQACSAPLVNGDGNLIYGSDFVNSILKLFPRAIAVSDNEGNLPIHMAGTSLQGDLGVDVIFMLLDEADKQANSDVGFRFSDLPKAKSVDDDSVSISTEVTATPTDSSNAEHDLMNCNLVRNAMGQTPLTAAIRAYAGWEVIEALAGGPGGQKAALTPDVNRCNALHLLVSEEFGDPVAALSILNIAPRSASSRNTDGMLPIEIASMQMMPREVVMALALVDLPIDLKEKDGVKVREEFGGSWWFLACECDDYHIDLVEEIISICNYQQLRELCFMKGGPNRSGSPVISCATRKSRQVLRKALRFVGRFEFLGNSAVFADEALGLKVFEALDFGTNNEPRVEGRRVMLHCYGREDSYRKDTSLLLGRSLDFEFVEKIEDFAVHEFAAQSSKGVPQQFCLAIERSKFSLDRVVEGMQKKEDYRYNEEMRNRYMNKVCVVLRLLAKAIRHFHKEGLVHGDICLETCGKFDDKWKLTNLLGSQEKGQLFARSRFGESSPPEAVDIRQDVPCFRDLEALPSVDIWAFGKLAFEAMTGRALFDFDPDVEVESDSKTMMELFNWGESGMRNMIDSLRHAGVPTVGIDLITHCLLPDPEKRLSGMDEILNHSFWKEMRRKTTSSTPRSTSSSRATGRSEI